MGRRREPDYKMAMRIKHRRIELGLTRQNVMELTGYGYQSIQGWEEGYQSPEASAIMKLAVALRVSPNYILGWSPFVDLNREGGQ